MLLCNKPGYVEHLERGWKMSSVKSKVTLGKDGARDYVLWLYRNHPNKLL